MRLAPLPAFAAQQRRNGLSASASALIAHDSAPTGIGALRTFGAVGPVTLVGGDLAAAPGNAGGLFSTSTAGGTVTVSFNRNGLGDGLAEGEAVTTSISPLVTDGVKTAKARIRVTVRRQISPPQLLGPIPDQLDHLS